MCCCCCECLADICLVIVSVLFPPLPVWIRRGVCSADAWINILLCLLGYVPGLIHSWYIIAKYPPYSYRNESKVYYVYQNSNDLESQRSEHHEHHHHHCHTVTNIPTPQPNPQYGSTSEHEQSLATSVGAPPAYTEMTVHK